MKRKILISFIITLTLTLTLLYFFGILHLNSPSNEKYSVKGIDVSAYQGNIDWNILSKENIAFAYIKATEGSSMVDNKFQFNWDNANKTQLYVGAYHFFSFETAGQTQAENFISAVGKAKENSMPPVIDIEYYNDEITKNTARQDIVKEITGMASALEEYYGVKPILYVSKATYNDFVKDNFVGYKFWVRSVYNKVNYIDENDWTIWQYSNRHRLKGYTGREPYIDMNVYNGDLEKFIDEFDFS